MDGTILTCQIYGMALLFPPLSYGEIWYTSSSLSIGLWADPFLS